MNHPVARHKTAMSRNALSRPVVSALADGVVQPGYTLFDYGCGRGDDVCNLAALGYVVDGWDPTHRPQTDRVEADVVNLGYVVNVIEEPSERAAVLRSAWRLARHALVVSARLTWDARDLAGRPLRDGIVTSSGTFQKFYGQSELAAWIEQTLGVEPIAAAPGIFYVFRDEAAAQQYLFNRVYTYRPRVRVDPHALYTAHQEVLTPLLDFMTAHARPPRARELSPDEHEAVRETFGSIGRGLRLIRQVSDHSHWDAVRVQRRNDLLIYVAMSRFGRRPKMSQLPTVLAGDIKALFGSYQAACIQADRLLLASGDPALILVSARSSKVGKQTPSALYVHRSALEDLPPVLRVYEACARVLTGTIDVANMIKLSVAQPQVSYLSYPTFDRDAHPTLDMAVTVNLRKLTVDWRDYAESANPPLLHRKEEFLGLDNPDRARYQRLTRSEMRAGLYESPERIGTLAGWQAVLAEKGMQVKGHRLVRSQR